MVHRFRLSLSIYIFLNIISSFIQKTESNFAFLFKIMRFACFKQALYKLSSKTMCLRYLMYSVHQKKKKINFLYQKTKALSWDYHFLSQTDNRTINFIFKAETVFSNFFIVPRVILKYEIQFAFLAVSSSFTK